MNPSNKVSRWQDLDPGYRRLLIKRAIIALILCVLFVAPTQLLMSYNWRQRAVLMDIDDHPLANTTLTVMVDHVRPKPIQTDSNGKFTFGRNDSLEGYTLARVSGQGGLATHYFAPSGTLVITAVDRENKPFRMIDVGFERPEDKTDLRWFTAMSGTFKKDGLPMDLDPSKIRVGLNGRKSRVVSFRVMRRTNRELAIQYILEPAS